MISPILSVKDIDHSVAFYTKKLGFKHDFSMPGPDGVNTFAFVSLGPATFIGLSRDEQLAHRGEGVQFMIYLPEEQDIDQVYAEVKERGITPETEIKTQYWGDRTFSVRDPDNYLLTIAHTVHQADMNEVAAIMRGEESVP
jgi:uncharacterized glyoxalase superfamily protein PhnB